MQTDQLSIEILIPLLNPNEPEALLADLHVQEGQKVAAGDLLCTLETTKSTAELPADQGGYVVGLRLAQGQTVRAGERLCYLSNSPDWTPPAEPVASTEKSTSVPDGLRITQPALLLAQSANLDLGRLPSGVLVTEKLVQQLLQSTLQSQLEPPAVAFDPTAILVYGGGGHGKALIELLRALHSYHIVAVIDDGMPVGQEILGVPVRGGAEVLSDLYAQGVRLAVNAVGGIGNLDIRLKVFKRLAGAGFTCPTLVHPSAVIEPSARLAAGVQVMPLAYVGSEADIGYGAIINTGAIVSHDCQIGDFANLSPGAILAGEVEIGSGALVGMGTTINLRVKVGTRVRIGNGATVKRDVPKGGIVRAGSVWPE
jgi:sugar O-acyltransferase (sialic acid O-acetyltransferase NeuD family)